VFDLSSVALRGLQTAFRSRKNWGRCRTHITRLRP